MSHRIIGQVYDVRRSTVTTIVIEVCIAMKVELYNSTVRSGPPGRVNKLNHYFLLPEITSPLVLGCEVHGCSVSLGFDTHGH